MFKKNYSLLILTLTGTLMSPIASAYYLIYSPTVEYGETEIELYGQYTSDSNAAVDGKQQYVLEYAKGITPKLFLEAKVEFEKQPNADLKTEAILVEGVYQLTEQGEYDWTFGLLGEVEYSVTNSELKEIEFGPIMATDFGRNMTFTTNIIFEYEVQQSKLEGGGAMQVKWRLGKEFEPAIEFYGNEYSNLIGPVVMGKIKTETAKFGYQLGWLVGMDDKSDDNTLKFVVEYEF